MIYTYVLRSKKDGRLYTGFTHDLRERLKLHNNGEVFSTKGRGPFEIIYYEACINKQDATMREKYLKSGMGKRYLKNRLRRSLSLTGFTIIELIVVIAIIAVLAAIVLVNVTTYINKGKNAAIKSNLASIMVKGTVYFESDATYKGSYQSFCGSSIVVAAQNAITNAGGTTNTCKCNDTAHTCADTTATVWCACAQEVPSTTTLTFCVDSTGYKQETSNACSTRCTAGACSN